MEAKELAPAALPEGEAEAMDKLFGDLHKEAQALFSELKDFEEFLPERLERVDAVHRPLMEAAGKYEEGGKIMDSFWQEADAVRQAVGYKPSAEFQEGLTQGYKAALIESYALEMAGENTDKVSERIEDLEFKMRLVGILVPEQEALMEEAKDLSGYKRWEQPQEVQERVIGGGAHPEPNKEVGADKLLTALEILYTDFYQDRAAKGIPAGEFPKEIGESPKQILILESEAARYGVKANDLAILRDKVMRETGYWDLLSRMRLAKEKEEHGEQEIA